MAAEVRAIFLRRSGGNSILWAGTDLGQAVTLVVFVGSFTTCSNLSLKNNFGSHMYLNVWL